MTAPSMLRTVFARTLRSVDKVHCPSDSPVLRENPDSPNSPRSAQHPQMPRDLKQTYFLERRCFF
jgi:hypothetical protein